MSDHEITQLEREIAERVERLNALKKPMTAAELRQLAKDDPIEFNRRFDAGLVPAAALGAKED